MLPDTGITEQEVMAKPYTHILFDYPTEKAHSLYRATDGMHLAYQQGCNVIFGNDPNPAKKEHRTFLDEKFALRYLRNMADVDENDLALTETDNWGGLEVPNKLQRCASIEERGGHIVQPGADLKLVPGRAN